MRVREANEVLGRIKTPADGYKALCASIIATACDDYLSYSARKDKLRLQSLERFFLSERFMLFSDGVDGSYILRRVQEMSNKYGDPSNNKPVNRYNLDGELMAKYASMTEAAHLIGGDRSCISQACKTGRAYKGFYWDFA